MTWFAIVLGIFYFLPGAAKLAGAPPVAEQFDEFGLGPNGMRAVGTLEVAAAVGLQFDGLDVFAAAGMVAMMIGAIFFHARAGHEPKDSIPAAVLLVTSAAFVVASL